jgi:KDO2-lipid IV(A) lauroyltransferase
LPLDCASALGGALARRIGPFLGVSKHARRNISRAFPKLSATEIGRVVAGMWDNLGRESVCGRRLCLGSRIFF